MNGANTVMDDQQPCCSSSIHTVPYNSPENNPSKQAPVTSGVVYPAIPSPDIIHAPAAAPAEDCNQSSSSNSSTETVVGPDYTRGQKTSVATARMPTVQQLTGDSQQMSSSHYSQATYGGEGMFQEQIPNSNQSFFHGGQQWEQQGASYNSQPENSSNPSYNYRNIPPFNPYVNNDTSFSHDPNYCMDDNGDTGVGECGAREIFSCLKTCLRELNTILTHGPAAGNFTSCLPPLEKIRDSILQSEEKFNADFFLNDHNEHSNMFCTYPKKQTTPTNVNVAFTTNTEPVPGRDDIETVLIATPPPPRNIDKGQDNQSSKDQRRQP